jgi:hypothetical protein
MKTVSELNQKTWYRLLQVIYFIVLWLIFLIAWQDAGPCAFCDTPTPRDWWSIGQTLLIMAAVTFWLQRIIYYIVLGSFTPKNK